MTSVDIDAVVAFLEARIGETEAIAKHATAGPWMAQADQCCDGPAVLAAEPVIDEWALTMRDAEHIALNDPARVLARCKADRAILAEHEAEQLGWERCCWCQIDDASGAAHEYPCDTVRALLSVWSDHPNFRPEWRP